MSLDLNHARRRLRKAREELRMVERVVMTPASDEVAELHAMY